MSLETVDRLITTLSLQKTNLPTYQLQVGATNADIAAVSSELDDLQYIVNFADLIDADKQTVTKIKNAMFSGNPDEPLSPFPVFPIGALPNGVGAGLRELAYRRNRRFKAAAGYTKEIGIALGIESEARELVPDSVKPSMQLFAAQSFYTFSVVIANRGASDMWDVMILRKGANGWSKAASATGKSIDVTVTPASAGEPEQMQVRVQLKKNNANYGQPSDIAYVTVNP
jgi:hypothetical protein